jgi:hypothetical protein
MNTLNNFVEDIKNNLLNSTDIKLKEKSETSRITLSLEKNTIEILRYLEKKNQKTTSRLIQELLNGLFVELGLNVSTIKDGNNPRPLNQPCEPLNDVSVEVLLTENELNWFPEFSTEEILNSVLKQIPSSKPYNSLCYNKDENLIELLKPVRRSLDKDKAKTVTTRIESLIRRMNNFKPKKTN